jgi:hypothetical protein
VAWDAAFQNRHGNNCKRIVETVGQPVGERLEKISQLALKRMLLGN